MDAPGRVLVVGSRRMRFEVTITISLADVILIGFGAYVIGSVVSAFMRGYRRGERMAHTTYGENQ
jgi:hypothetical protein